MRSLIIRVVISAIAIGVITSGILPGIRIEGNIPPTWVALTIIFTLVNLFIKPILRFLTCPFIILSLGLIGFIINTALLYLTAFLGNQLISLTGGRLVIDNFLYALVASVIVTITTIVLEQFIQTAAPKRRETVSVQKITEVRYVVQQQRADFDDQFNQQLSVGNPPAPGYTDVSAQQAPHYQQPPPQQYPPQTPPYQQPPPEQYPPQAPPDPYAPPAQQPPLQSPRPFGSQGRPPQTGTPDDWDFDDPAFPKR